jgi:hypothetical protein
MLCALSTPVSHNHFNLPVKFLLKDADMLYEQLGAHLYRRVPTTSAGPQICSAQQQHVSAI